MRVDWVALRNFRSYNTLEWAPESGVNLLLGANGAGKTNLLEAIAYLATLRSFRSVPDSGLVRDGEDAAVIRAGVSSGDRDRLQAGHFGAVARDRDVDPGGEAGIHQGQTGELAHRGQSGRQEAAGGRRLRRALR